MTEITRKISTRMAIEGEAEYKQKITDVNRSMRTLQSEIALTDSKFKGNANTIEALTAKNDVLGKAFAEQTKKVQFLKDALANAEKAAANYAKANVDIKSKIEATEKELADLKNTSGDTTKEQERLTKQLQLLNKDLQDNEARTAATERGILDWQKQLNNAEIELNDINDELKNNAKYMDEAKNSVDGAATSIDKYGKEVKTASDKNTKAVSDMAQALAAAGVVASIKAITEALMESINASMEWESAFAGVIKTVDGTDAQLAKIADGIKEMSLNIPASTTEIAKIAETAGQLGIKTDDVLKFTETMMALGVSTNLTAEDAATMIAQFANITKLDSSKYGNLGSAIVSLGNNYATTEQKIMDMSQKIASAATIAGFSESDILGLSTAISSLGIESDAGGSAMSKLIAKMQSAVETGEGLNDFAYVANMSAEDFTKLWGEDAAGALSAFVGGLSDTERTGSTALVMLDEMGLSEVRLRNAVLSLSNAGGLLNDTLKTSKSAFEDNNALQEEAAKRYATSESKMQLLKNSINVMKIAVGDTLKPVLDKVADVGRGIADFITDLVKQSPELVQIVTALTIAVGIFSAGLTAYTAVTKLATIASQAFTTAMETSGGKITLIITAIAAAVSAIGFLVAAFGDGDAGAREFAEAAYGVDESLKQINDTFTESIGSIDGTVESAYKYLDRLKELEDQGLKTKDAQAEYQATVDLLNDTIPGLNLKIDEQTGRVDLSTEAIRFQIQAWKDLAVEQAKQALLGDLIKNQTILEVELNKNRRDLKDTSKELTEKEGALAAARERQEQLAKRLTPVQQESNKAFREANSLVSSLSGEVDALKIKQGNLTKAVAEGEEALGKAKDEIKKTEEAYDDLYGATSKSDIAAKKMGKTYAEDLPTSYAEFQKAARKADRELQKADEYKNLAEKNVVGYVDGVQVMYGSVEEAMAAMAGTAEQLDQYDEAYKDGQSTAKGYAAGVGSMAGTVSQRFAKLSEQALKAYRNTMGIRSPSKKAIEDAEYTVEGYIKGIDNKRLELAEKMEGLANTGALAYAEKSQELQKMIARSVPTDISVYATSAQQTELANAINRMTANNQNSKVDNLISLLREYLPRISNMQVVTDTGALVGAIVPQMDTALAGLQTKKERGK